MGLPILAEELARHASALKLSQARPSRERTMAGDFAEALTDLRQRTGIG